jgi:DNA-binding IscR family transcriptional regulator
MADRYVEVLKEGKWTRKEWDEIKIGDILRIFEPDGTPVEGKWKADPHSTLSPVHRTWTALEEPSPADATGKITVNPYEVPVGA